MSKFQKKIAIWIAAILVPVVANAFKAGDTIRVQMGKVYSGVDYGDYIDFVWIPESMVSEKRKEAGFWISKHMIHQRMPNLWLDFIHYSSGNGDTSLPIDYLTKTDVRILLSRLNDDKRLYFTIPSVEQWKRAYNFVPTGEAKIYKHQIWDYAWLAENSKGRIHSIGKKKAYPSGLYDLVGNVAEWCRLNDALPISQVPDKSLVTIGCGFDGHYDDAFCPDYCSLHGGLRLCVEPKGYPLLKSGDTLVLNREPKLIKSIPGPQDHTTRLHFYDASYTLAALEEGIRYVPVKSNVLRGGWFEPFWWFDLGRLPASIPRVDIIKLHNAFNEVLDVAEELHRIVGSECNMKGVAKTAYYEAFRTCWQLYHDDEFWQGILKGKPVKAVKSYTDMLGYWRVMLDAEIISARAKAFGDVVHDMAGGKAVGTKNDVSMKIGEIYSRYKNCLTVVNTEQGSGSGFIVRSYGTVYFYTNKHVIDGCKKCRITAIGNRRVKLRDAEVATNTDIARGIVQSDYVPQGDILEFESAQPILGEKIYVIGNSDGLGVQTLLEGKIIGVTPDLSIIEIDAPIVHGNSGSPVLNERGKVVGVASFATKGEGAEVRRFAIRPQAGVTWKPRAK